ncbi:MAG: tyrosine-type recombinase/integrase, partial [Anaerolineae bacterium]
MAEDHLADYARRAQPSSVVARRYGISYALPHLGKLQVTEIGIDHALALRDAFPGSPSKATKAWIAATEILALALSRGLVQANPFKAVKAPERPQSRDRHPSLAELARIEAAALADDSVGADLVRFVFRTGLRVQAAASLQWSEVDLDNAELRLAPAAGRKFKQTLRLPLGASAVELLRKTARTEGTDLVFPGRDRRGAPAQFRSWNWLYGRLRKASGVADWSAHDFRRALVSLTAEHRPDINVVALDRLLGHTGGGTLGTVAGVYQRSSMLVQMLEAVDAW